MSDFASVDALAEAASGSRLRVGGAPEHAELMETLDLVVQRTAFDSVARFDLEPLRGADLVERGRLLSAPRERPELLAGFEPSDPTPEDGRDAGEDMLDNIDNYVSYMWNRWIDRNYGEFKI